MPIVGASEGARSIWKDEHSMTWIRASSGGSSARIGVPILPPSCASRPASRQNMGDQRCRRRLAIGAGDRDERRAGPRVRRVPGRRVRCRQSPRRPAPWRAGRSNAGRDASTARRASESARRTGSSRRRPNPRHGFSRRSPWRAPASLSSQAVTLAPPAMSAFAVARPEPPRPKSATLLPLNVLTGVIVTSVSALKVPSAPARTR